MSVILSVGIDIGTTTTQVIFSRIEIDNTASFFTVPRISVLGKEIVYRSAVHLTPLRDEVFIDGGRVREIVAGEYEKAGFTPGDVDTGAVIITGEAARKENAATVLGTLSDFAGDFVVSTAGPDLESVISGKGSGAWQYSLDNLCRVMNLDIGGGTTNMVLFDCGETAGKGCLDIGGRLIRVDEKRSISYIAPSAALIAGNLGLDLKTGMPADEKRLSEVTDAMADILAQAAGLKPAGLLADKVRTGTSSVMETGMKIDRICFSGGVADCIRSGPENVFAYGDIGILLGRSVRNNPFFSSVKQIEAAETIRATVIGAGTYTMNLSGSTISYSEGIFPVRNIPVCKLPQDVERECFRGNREPLAGRMKWFMSQNGSERMVLAMKGPKDPSFGELELAADCIMRCAEELIPYDIPVIVIAEEDIAKALGIAMKGVSGEKRKIASVDSIRVDEGDFLDIGTPLMDGLVVPVVVKTLLFG